MDYELSFCDKCIAMTNHPLTRNGKRLGKCLKCAVRKHLIRLFKKVKNRRARSEGGEINGA